MLAVIDVTAILLAHTEGSVLVDRALKSLVRSVEYAEKIPISVEILIVLDRPDKETSAYFENLTIPRRRTIQVDCGDPGLSRNRGGQAAEGRYVTFLDGDNLFSEQWIYKAYRYLETAGENVVAHPEYHIFFDQRNFALRQISSNSPSFKAANLLMTNFWDTVAMSRKEIYVNHPYVETLPKVGLGYEDWHFDCETITNGIEHHVVPDTVHFMRSKEVGSICKDSIHSYRLLPPTQLLQPAVFRKYYEQTVYSDNVEPKLCDLRKLKHQLKQFVKAVFPSLKKQAADISHKNQFDKQINKLPKDIRDELNTINTIESLIYQNAITSYCCLEDVDNSPYTKAYYSLCNAISDETYKFILLICDTSSSCSDSIENSITDIITNHENCTLVVIDTCSEGINSTHSLRMQKELFTLVNLDESLYDGKLSMIIALFILNVKPESVYLINCNLANVLHERYGTTIKEATPIKYIDHVPLKVHRETL